MPAPTRRTSSAALPRGRRSQAALPPGPTTSRLPSSLRSWCSCWAWDRPTYRRCGGGSGDDARLDDFAAEAHRQAIFSSRMDAGGSRVGALVAPGVARAAGSPPGMSMSDLTTTVGTALAQVDAAAPGAGAAAEPAVMQALGAASALSSLARGPAPPAGPPNLPEPTPPTAVAPAVVTTSVVIPRSCPRPLFRPLSTPPARATRWQESTPGARGDARARCAFCGRHRPSRQPHSGGRHRCTDRSHPSDAWGGACRGEAGRPAVWWALGRRRSGGGYVASTAPAAPSGAGTRPDRARPGRRSRAALAAPHRGARSGARLFQFPVCVSLASAIGLPEAETGRTRRLAPRLNLLHRPT